jgi:parvulin-like peptidyl-prolyl isomerase
MKKKVAPIAIACGLVFITQQGCATNPSRQLDTALFVAPAIGDNSGGAVEPDPAIVSVQLPPDAPQNESPKTAEILPGSQPRALDTVKPLDAIPTGPTTMLVAAESGENIASSESASPTTAPADRNSADIYMTLGGVLAQVNDTPIYANQVLTPLRKEFNAKAREMDASAFRDFAEQEIGRELRELIEDELQFATTYHALTDEDKKIADAVAIQARKEKITAAGGSVEQAKRLSLEDGEDFDASIKQEYRRIVYQLYRRRRIEPLIQVTADDMRDFYTANVGKLYSEKDEAQFRVIAIDPASRGGTKAARDLIESIRAKAAAGADFAKLACAENDDPYLKGRRGNPCDDGGWMEKNTYRIDAVEGAAWSIEPGQVSPVIETEGKLYIVHLDAKHNGTVKAFEDQTVQDDIYNRLYQEQLSELWRKSKDDSVGDGMISTDETRVQVAVDMAMQGYAMVEERK